MSTTEELFRVITCRVLADRRYHWLIIFFSHITFCQTSCRLLTTVMTCVASVFWETRRKSRPQQPLLYILHLAKVGKLTRWNKKLKVVGLVETQIILELCFHACLHPQYYSCYSFLDTVVLTLSGHLVHFSHSPWLLDFRFYLSSNFLIMNKAAPYSHPDSSISLSDLYMDYNHSCLSFRWYNKMHAGRMFTIWHHGVWTITWS